MNESYEVLVKEGQELLRRDEKFTSQMCWEWGDLALKVVPMKKGEGRNRGVERELKRWAADIGWFIAGRKLGTLQKYRKVAAAWLSGRRRPETSFAAHEATKAHPELLEDGMSRTAAREAVTGKKEREPKSIADEKAQELKEAAHEVNEDLDAQKEAAKDPEIREEITEVYDAVQTAGFTEEEVPVRPMTLEYEIEGELRSILSHYKQIANKMAAADRPGDDEDILDLFDRAINAGEMTKEGYQSGTSTDSFIDKILN